MIWGRRYGALGDDGEEAPTFGQTYADYANRNEARACVEEDDRVDATCGVPTSARDLRRQLREWHAYVRIQIAPEVPHTHAAYDAVDN